MWQRSTHSSTLRVALWPGAGISPKHAGVRYSQWSFVSSNDLSSVYQSNLASSSAPLLARTDACVDGPLIPSLVDWRDDKARAAAPLLVGSNVEGEHVDLQGTRLGIWHVPEQAQERQLTWQTSQTLDGAPDWMLGCF